jgi:6-phosphogluconolactonase
MKPAIQTFKTKQALVEKYSLDLYREICAKKDRYHLALSGGSTPRLLYSYWSAFFKDKLDTIKKLHFYCGDERCVPPDNPQSNFGMVQAVLFSRLSIDLKNVHRMRGEAEPQSEARRYEQELRESIAVNKAQIPVFDHILLGVGADGHTASLFAGSPLLKTRDKLCVVVYHPRTGQTRLSLTLAAINQARQITFIVTGEDKQDIITDIFSERRRVKTYPASMVQPVAGHFSLYMDTAAARKLNHT